MGLAFLQHPVEVDELFGSRNRCMHPGKEVLLHSIDSDMTGITFCVRLSNGVLKSHEPILPRGNGSFCAVELLPPSDWLPLQPDVHRIRRRQSPTPINKWRLASQQEASPGKHWHIVKTHMIDCDAPLEEAVVLAQRDDCWRPSWRGLLP
jgi:hypothetical protein